MEKDMEDEDIILPEDVKYDKNSWKWDFIGTELDPLGIFQNEEKEIK